MATVPPMTDIQLTPSDRAQLDALLASLAERGTHLAVLSEHDRVLDHLAQLLTDRLGAQAGASVSWGQFSNAEQLVQQFNDILSEMTLDQALGKDRAHAPRRYLMIRDSILVQDTELRLLARLVNGFPASNTSVILLINPVASHPSKLEAFGKSLLRWPVQTRAGAPRQALPNLVADTPPDTPADAPRADRWPQAPAPTWRIPDADSTRSAVPPTATPSAAPSAPLAAATRSEPVVPRRPWLRARFAPAFWLLVPLLSLLLAGWLYREGIDREYQAWRQSLLRGTPAPQAASTVTPPSAPAADRTLSVQASLAPQEEVVPAAPAAQVSPIADEAWMEQLALGGYVVQLAVFDTQAEILNFQRSDPVYADARVVRMYRKDRRQRSFALIAGPMPTRAQAEAFMQSHRLLAKGWLRAAQSLKAKL